MLENALIIRLQSFEKLFVGFSGGLDSTVLLHYLSSQPELKTKVIAVHIHHGLSKNAAQWEKHCEQFCKRFSLPFISKRITINSRVNLEEAARVARYEVFAALLSHKDAFLTGHHLNDQAETVLLHLFRGTGVDGLAGMAQETSLGKGKLIRPLLALSRQQLEEYAKARQLAWVDDESNLQLVFARNYLRHTIIPQLQKFWPSVDAAIARSALHCQQAKQNLEDLAKWDAKKSSVETAVLDLAPLEKLKKARLINVLRLWIKNNKATMPAAILLGKLVEEIIGAREDAQPLLRWDTVEIRRYQQKLYLLKEGEEALPQELAWPHFPKPLVIREWGKIKALPAKKGLVIPPQAKIEIRFREGGENFNWHGQSKSLKKLWQQWKVPPWLRKRIPLLYVNGKLAAVIGYAISDDFYRENDTGVNWIVRKMGR